jgi:uncharacterized protein (DUF305 family)
MTHRSTLTAAAAAAITIGLAAPGAGSAAATPTHVAKATATATDKAFVREMIPHHMMADEMATMAKTQGQHAEIRALARRIISAQSAEITRMKGIAKTLAVTPAAMPQNGDMSMQTMDDLATLKISMSQSGMMMNMSELDGAKPFDRKFIDLMVPHHQGAIRMARAELARGKNAQLRSIATGIVADQAKEITQMNSWRKKWYGKTSPAGGVPKA